MQIYSFSFETDCVFQVKIKKTTPIILADYGSLYYFRISLRAKNYFLFRAMSIATAIATEAPTIGLLPIPRKPIIST